MLSILQSMPEFDPQIAAEFGNGMSASTFLGVPVFEAASFSNLLIRFAFNLIVAFVTVHYLYYRHRTTISPSCFSQLRCSCSFSLWRMSSSR